MYSKEYRCTKLETKKTTSNIVADNESNKKIHSIVRMSTRIHLRGRITTVLVDSNDAS